MKIAMRRVALVCLDIVRGVCMGLLLTYAIYQIFMMPVMGPLFRYAGY